MIRIKRLYLIAGLCVVILLLFPVPVSSGPAEPEEPGEPVYIYLADGKLAGLYLEEGRAASKTLLEKETALSNIRVDRGWIYLEEEPPPGQKGKSAFLHNIASKKSIEFQTPVALELTREVAFSSASMTIAYAANDSEGNPEKVVAYNVERNGSFDLEELPKDVHRLTFDRSGKHIAFLARRIEGSARMFFGIYSLEQRSVEWLAEIFYFPKGIHITQGISWSPDNRHVLIAGACVTGDNEVKGCFTCVRVETGEARSFARGYFGGWLNNEEILVTSMPEYKLCRFDLKGRLKSLIREKCRGFALVGRDIILGKTVGARDKQRKFLLDSEGNVVTDKLPEEVPLPRDIRQYSYFSSRAGCR